MCYARRVGVRGFLSGSNRLRPLKSLELFEHKEYLCDMIDTKKLKTGATNEGAYNK